MFPRDDIYPSPVTLPIEYSVKAFGLQHIENNGDNSTSLSQMPSRVGVTNPPGIILFDVDLISIESINNFSQQPISDHTITLPTIHQKIPVSPDRHAIIPTPS